MGEVHGVVQEAMAVGHAMSLALALAQGACPVALLSGNLVAAEQFIDMLLKHTTEHALDLWHAWGRCLGATLQIMRGGPQAGLNALRGVLDELPQGAFFAQNAGIHATLAEALGKVCAVSDAHLTLDNALGRSERHEERWYLAEFLRIKGELYRLEGTPEAFRRAEEQLRLSIDCARSQVALSWELRASMSLARLYRQQGRPAEALQALAPVYERFTEGFETADLRAAEALISAVS
jgi:predicted ATPase